MAKDSGVRVMGILNVTPDSFSDGGRFLEAEAAIERGLQMLTEGADIIDVGGESTRPGAAPVSEAEEKSRILKVIEGIAVQPGAIVSVDTSKAAVAEAAIEAGAGFLNDVTAGSDPRMLALAEQSGLPICLMHMRGVPGTMQAAPDYSDVVAEVDQYLRARKAAAMEAGVEEGKIFVDPGIGFGKTVEHNLRLIRNLRRFTEIGPVLLGASRKTFIGEVLGLSTENRLTGSISVATLAAESGVSIIRAHDVRETRQAVDMVEAVMKGGKV